MMDTEILDMLDHIGRASVARLSPAVTLAGDSVSARRDAILRVIRGTILPRRLEFTAANGDCLAVEVNSSRITNVFRVRMGQVPDFETEDRAGLTKKLARHLSDIASAPAPLELLSLQPDSGLEADDVGITFSELAAACAGTELAAETVVAVVADDDQPVKPADSNETVASRFFDGAQRFAAGRVLAVGSDGDARLDGACAKDAVLHPDSDLLTRFAADLNGWTADSEAEPDQPQLIVMRPSGGKGTGLAIVKNGEEFAIAVHETRKLGSVVNLWAALQEADQ